MWLLNSNYIVVRSVPDEHQLNELGLEAGRRGIAIIAVNEPDLDDGLTALALGPGSDAQKLCANLPLALKECINA